jgi:hypothetical protein
VWREHNGRPGRLAKRTSLALDWHKADIVERTCECGPLRVDAGQLRTDVSVALRQGQPFVFATEAVPEVAERHR